MKKIEYINPWKNEVFGHIDEATEEEVFEVMGRAKDAFLEWSKVEPKDRVKYLIELRDYIVDNLEELSEAISKTTGKVYIEAITADLYTTLEFLKYYEKNLVNILQPKKIPTPIVFYGKKSYIEYKPMGVIAVIAPWNYPFQLSVLPIISALAAGNCVILKPSEVTPYVGELIEKMFNNTSLPKGVVQVVHGGKECGQALIKSKPDKIFFTGSVATGKKIMEEAAKELIPIELELGGKDPMIVLEDANIDRAVNGALWGAFTNSGQVCMSVERVYVHEDVYDAFLAKLLAEADTLKHGKHHHDDIGTMTFYHQINTITNHLEDAVAKGAEIVFGDRERSGSKYHFAPTIVTNVTHDMAIMREETFGPVIPIMKVKSEGEAIRLANDSTFGLNASIWTGDIHRGKRIAKQLVTGNCCINDVIVSVANPHLPFGGVKESGIGRYHGKEGIYTFSHQTSVIVDKGSKSREFSWYPYTKEKYEAFIDLIKNIHGKEKIKPWKLMKTFKRLR